MAKPSLRASSQGQQLAEQSLRLAGLTKKSLSEAVGCSRQPVTNFFKGVAVEQPLFIELCDHLTLNWQQVAGLTSPAETKMLVKVPSDVSSPQTIDQIVQQLRQTAQGSLQERCGTMRVLDMSHPVGLSDIYTSVNILEQISGRQRRRLQDLITEVEAENFDRIGFGKIEQARVPAMEAIAQYNKLIVLGKPGAGKTTFLKYLAVQCIEGRFKPDQLPLFVNLKQFAENPNRLSLLAFISQRHLKSELTSLRESEVEAQQRLLKQVLMAGRAIILLDGLDEVNQEEQDWVLREIRILSEEFQYNQFLMTCRIAAWEYTFEQFTEVEIADFDAQQVATFVPQWFRGKAMQPRTFLRNLAQQPRLSELAVTPLLLTLLCLAFEASGSLPGSRSELYREGVETLLKKWDASRGIHRDQVYRRLSVKRKEDLLGQIALTTFRQRQYFFKQSHLEQSIADYIRNLPEASDDPDILQIDSTTILHSIEAQHGLLVERAKHYYSFSHLTFHEYFVARELVFNSSNLEKAMKRMVEDYALDSQWREVFLLVSELLRDADLLLSPLLQRIQSLLAGSPRLQAFLADISEQSTQARFAHCKPAAVRAFLFDIDFDIDENREVAIRLDQLANWLVCASFLTRMLEGVGLEQAIAIVQSHDQQVTDPAQKVAQAISANDAMMIAIAIALSSKQINSGESRTLRDLIHRLDHCTANDEDIKEVADAARHVAKDRHHIGQGWTFDAAEKQLLKQYYRATRLLVDCLYSDGCMLGPKRRQAIEDNLFTPPVNHAD
ncbi:MAG: NACHT domain-containing protein [Phormidesmis sp.]